MKDSGGVMQHFQLLKNKKQAPVEEPKDNSKDKPKGVLAKIWNVIRILALVIYRLRGIFMAIPVILVALRLAAYNAEHLPLLVGINLQTTGEFAKTISRNTAVTFPLFVTGGCLVMTFLSRKNLYPWLISIFSLVIPVFLYITNMYPA